VRLACVKALENLDKDRAFLKNGGVFDDDFIDAYIELKMTEVARYEDDAASGRVRNVLFAVNKSAALPPASRHQSKKALLRERLFLFVASPSIRP